MASEVDHQEFDAWTGDHIGREEDVSKLRRASEYFRQEGIYVTAKTVEDRLAQLIGGRSPDSSDIAEVASNLSSFQAEVRQKESIRQNKSRAVGDSIAQLQPPVRSSIRSPIKAPAVTVGKAKAIPRSQDLTDQSLQQEEEPPLGGAPLKISSSSSNSNSSMPGRSLPKRGVGNAGAAAAAAVGGLVQEVELRGAKRTQQLIRQNQNLPPADKVALAEQERIKGNEHFRSGNAAEAVECYTLSIALDPSQLAAYTNRAQAYLRLKQWGDAVVDCTSALDAIEAQEAAGVRDAGQQQQQHQLRMKALMRRGKALSSQQQHAAALQDYTALQALAPEDKEVQQLAAQARKALGLVEPPPAAAAAAAAAISKSAAAAVPHCGVKRIAVVEVEDESDEESDDNNQQQQQRSAPPEQQAPAVKQQQQVVSPAKQQQQQVVSPAKKKQQQQQVVSPTKQQQQQQHVVSPNRQRRVIPVVVESDTDDESSSGLGSGDDTNADQQQQQELAAAPTATAAAAAGAAEGPPAASAAAAAAPAGQAGSQVVFAPANSNDSCSSSSGSDGGGSSGGRSDDKASDGSSGSSGGGCVGPPFAELLDSLVEEGSAALKQGSYNAALECYSRALQRDPASVRVHTDRALALLKLNKAEKAHEAATTAIALDPRSAEPYYARHKAKEALGDFKGAVADLSTVVTLQPSNTQRQKELSVLKRRAQAVAAAAAAQAEYQRHASRTVADSCTIEEVADDPEEEQQRKHQDLRANENLFTKRAAKLKAQAAQIQQDYEAARTLLLAQQQQQQQQRSRRQQQRQQSWAEMRQQREQRLAGSSAAAAVDADAVDISPTPLAAAGAAAPAGPPTPPASHCEAPPTAAAAAADTPSPTQRRQPPAQPPPAAAAAAVGLPGEEGATGPSTPRGGSLTAPTPTSTPAAPGLFVFGSSSSSPAATAAAAAAPATSSDAQQQQQQQQQQGRYLSAAAVEASIAGQVAALADKGRALQQSGDSEGALAAYREALDLDQDNVRVLSNLAALYLQRNDGKAALRCCDEVLALQGTTHGPDATFIHKAMLRRGLALELLGDFEGALQLLGQVKGEAGATADPRLAADLLRLSKLVQQQKRQQQAAAATAAAAAAAGEAAAPTAAAAGEGCAEAETVGAQEHSRRGFGSSPDDSEATVTDDELQQQQQQHEEDGNEVVQRSTSAAAAGSSTGGGAGAPLLWDPYTELPYTAAAADEQLPPPGSLVSDDWKGFNPTDGADSSSGSSSNGDSSSSSSSGGSSDKYESLGSAAAPPSNTHKQQQQKSSKPQQQQQQSKQQGSKRAATEPNVEEQIQQMMKLIEQRQAREQQQKLVSSPDRDKGNAAFKAGNWQAALRHYKAAIEADPVDVRAYANRAQVYLKLKRPAKVEEDCDLVVLLLQQHDSGTLTACPSLAELDAAGVRQLRAKVLYRRALARKDLGKIKEALTDTKQLLADTANSDAAVQRLHDELTAAYKQQLQRLVAASRSEQAAGDETGENETPPDEDTAAAAAEDSEGAPVVKLHRIVIEETDGSDSDSDSEGVVVEEGGGQPERQGGSSSSNDSEEDEVVLTVQPAARSKGNAALMRGLGVTSAATAAASGSQATAAVRQQQQQPAAVTSAAALASGASSKLAQQQQQRVLTAPKSASEFQTTAKSLLMAAPAAAAGSNASSNGPQQQQQQQLGSYVRLLPPSQYVSVFKEGLTVEHLKLLLQGLGQVSAEGDLGFAEQGLAALAQVPRFGIVYAMVDRGSKGVVGEVVGRLEAAGSREVEGLRNKYRV